ncbi:hypothetical protein [Alteromonas ponticola]|uniref:LysM domain-containing protein n=1 Tax=Alteromonas ponticola TaxID=2720613 RepID=A0ABX1QY26_9ALTE|nr:hypothetical protein [Alteromonas ponticola]NMH59145.1 hypothetical protein [Alteromonas ponticola]
MTVAMHATAEKPTDTSLLGCVRVTITDSNHTLDSKSVNARDVAEQFAELFNEQLVNNLLDANLNIDGTSISWEIESLEDGSLKVFYFITAILGNTAAVITIADYIEELRDDEKTITTPDNRYECKIDVAEGFDNVYQVKFGDTLFSVASQYSNEFSLTQRMVMVVLYHVNCHAFGENPDDLKAGAILMIPSDDGFKRLYAEFKNKTPL